MHFAAIRSQLTSPSLRLGCNSYHQLMGKTVEFHTAVPVFTTALHQCNLITAPLDTDSESSGPDKHIVPSPSARPFARYHPASPHRRPPSSLAPSRFAELHVSVAQHLRISSEKRVCGCGQMKRECGCPCCLVQLQDRHRAVKTWRRSRRVTGYSRGENTVIPIVEEHKRELSRGVCGDKRWSVLRIEPVRWIIPPTSVKSP